MNLLMFSLKLSFEYLQMHLFYAALSINRVRNDISVIWNNAGLRCAVHVVTETKYRRG